MSPAEELARYLGARSAELDGTRIVPMLCERAEAGARVLERPGWLFELKLDGVRIVADKRANRVVLSYRKRRDATDSYAEIADAVRSLGEERLVLDGEIVAFDDEGRPDFQRLGHRIQTSSSRPRAPGFVPVVYVVFDVLAIGPYDLRPFPLEARKEILARIIPSEGAANGLLRRHPTFEHGVDLFRLCQEKRLEGVVAKRLGTAYKEGERSLDWLKIKAELDAEFVVIGWTEGEGERARLGALDLGAYEGERLVYRGRVGSGLDASTIDRLLELLRASEVREPVAKGKYSPAPKRRHCTPEVVVSVRYGGFTLDPTGARFLRFPVFRGVRPDVDPVDCTVAPDPPRATPARRIHVTAESQPIFADGTTKGELCAYFEAVAPALLRHVRGRCCALLGPDAVALWPPPKWMPKFVRTTSVRAERAEARGFVVDSLDVLLFAVEAKSPCVVHGPFVEDQPDIVDFVAIRARAEVPSGGPAVVAAARSIRDVAREIGLPAVSKSAGLAAVDVLIGVAKAPASAAAPLATLIAHLASQRCSAGAGVGVVIEAVRTVTAPFAPCPAGAGRVLVSVPLGWEELDGVDLDALDLRAGIARADAARPDPLEAITQVDVDIAAATMAIERIVLGASPPRAKL